ncbi:uncharacterized protein LACBIDRAFT_315394 [Laccaria bicolor S238N-H82]|uniref:Predicted protein n=1 Tax=Laccaria bicolor (strain S238N-H82 / ATCC MYA-4686) TaxID=486041 RepID=B0D2A5_LACBS|nr:uncharacterized protein LACBIDRAFT_315394 [Laccaria bicolor S238N-H82]EDR11070.1 predicted protein [Laccaria bicolor S238N-H82]|eukprot:XP_001878371.1 predicted protein [Laccaria bicolor S238N-H82]
MFSFRWVVVVGRWIDILRKHDLEDDDGARFFEGVSPMFLCALMSSNLERQRCSMIT